MERIDVVFISSSGGHFEQLMMLKRLMKYFSSVVLTEKTAYIESAGSSIMFLPQTNRFELTFPFKLFANFIMSCFYLLKLRPRCVVSTGALSCIPFCLLSKLFGIKLIFIESFAKTSSPTLTGRLMYRIADRFYVQWESMLSIYPDARFVGCIY